MTYTDYKYPKHHVAVDCIVFGYKNNALKILLSHRRFEPDKNKWSLMGGWLQETETVEEAAKRVVFQISGLQDIYLEQVHVFSDPKRDTGGRVVSVAFYAMIRIDKHDKNLVEKYGAKWWNFNNKPTLVFDHNLMVEHAHEKLKQKANYELIGRNLLPGKFTILQLRKLYEAIFQKQIEPANFRKKILSLKAIERMEYKNKTDSKKGAYYYRFKEPKNNDINNRIIIPEFKLSPNIQESKENQK